MPRIKPLCCGVVDRDFQQHCGCAGLAQMSLRLLKQHVAYAAPALCGVDIDSDQPPQHRPFAMLLSRDRKSHDSPRLVLRNHADVAGILQEVLQLRLRPRNPRREAGLIQRKQRRIVVMDDRPQRESQGYFRASCTLSAAFVVSVAGCTTTPL